MAYRALLLVLGPLRISAFTGDIRVLLRRSCDSEILRVDTVLTAEVTKVDAHHCKSTYVSPKAKKQIQPNCHINRDRDSDRFPLIYTVRCAHSSIMSQSRIPSLVPSCSSPCAAMAKIWERDLNLRYRVLRLQPRCLWAHTKANFSISAIDRSIERRKTHPWCCCVCCCCRDLRNTVSRLARRYSWMPNDHEPSDHEPNDHEHTEEAVAAEMVAACHHCQQHRSAPPRRSRVTGDHRTPAAALDATFSVAVGAVDVVEGHVHQRLRTKGKARSSGRCQASARHQR